jgi:hypothetical protein
VVGRAHKIVRKVWEEAVGYRRRSLAVASIVSNKNGLPARLLEAQITQSIFYYAALNRMTHLGLTEIS